MKICFACSQTLPKDKFSKKQWQAKQQRRCKECIVDNREANLEVPNDGVGDEGTLCWTDEDLFKQPPPNEECPICLMTLPLEYNYQKYQACCGKTICLGCIRAIGKEDRRGLCPFCRSPEATSEGEVIERMNKRADAGDADAFLLLGGFYDEGKYGLRQSSKKANKLLIRAGELGCASAYNKIGFSYDNGRGVEKDMKKAKYYYELAAMGGNVCARHNLGCMEGRAGNMDRAMTHLMIAAGAGCDASLKKIRECFLDGHATKDDFEKALRAHKEAKDEMKSDQREAAAAFYGQN
jgi:hypothetical protein